MTADTLLTQMEQMENPEKNKFLDKIYDRYFDKGVPLKTLAEHARILELYYDRELDTSAKTSKFNGSDIDFWKMFDDFAVKSYDEELNISDFPRINFKRELVTL